MNNEELIQKIYEWADARNLIKGSNAVDQGMKILSELGELADRGLARKNEKEVKDGIGDVAVVMTVIAGQVGLVDRVKDIVSKLPNKPENSGADKLTNTKQKVLVLTQFIVQSIMAVDAKQKEAFENNFLPIIFSVLAVIASEENFTFNECLAQAYNDIKDRTGILWNGVFVKSTDPTYEDAVKAVAEQNK